MQHTFPKRVQGIPAGTRRDWFSVSQAFKCLEKPCPESNLDEKIWRSSGHLVLLCSVPSYSQQSCGSILWLCGNASPAHQEQKLPRHASPSGPSCWNTTVPGFVLCSSSAPATCGADFTVWLSDQTTCWFSLCFYTLQPTQSRLVMLLQSLPSYDTMSFCEIIFSRILLNLQWK